VRASSRHSAALALLAVAVGAAGALVASGLPDALESLTSGLAGAGRPIAAPFSEAPPPIAGAAGVAITLALLTVAARLLLGPVRPLDARLRILLVLAYAVLVSATVSTAKLLILAAVAAAAAAAVRLPPRRLAMLLPVTAIAGLAALSWLPADPEEGLRRGGLILSKALLSAFAALLLRHTTSASQTWHALRGLGAPHGLVLAASMLERSVVAMGEEGRRVALALRARGAPASRRLSAAALGALFTRTLDRGARVRLAMEARGYDAGRPPPRPTGMDASDAAFAGSIAVLFLLVAWL
jgi:cobalt/nickel transport system permease protein